MSDSAIGAALKATRTALVGANALWGSKVFSEQAEENMQRPYVVMIMAGAASPTYTVKPDMNVRLIVKCVADTMVEAIQGAEAISQALDDRGSQDAPWQTTKTLVDGGADWTILTITELEGFHINENVDNVRGVYHAGAAYRFVMQRK